MLCFCVDLNLSVCFLALSLVLPPLRCQRKKRSLCCGSCLPMPVRIVRCRWCDRLAFSFLSFFSPGFLSFYLFCNVCVYLVAFVCPLFSARAPRWRARAEVFDAQPRRRPAGRRRSAPASVAERTSRHYQRRLGPNRQGYGWKAFVRFLVVFFFSFYLSLLVDGVWRVSAVLVVLHCSSLRDSFIVPFVQ